MNDHSNNTDNPSAGLATIALLLVVVLVALSAYLRLAHSGIGCLDWPACYGQIGELPAARQAVDPADVYQDLIDEANQPLSWATPLHRLVASVLGLVIVFMSIGAFRRRRNRLISFALLALTVFLAVIGFKSGTLHSRAVIMGNLAGGFFMLGLLGWLVFNSAARAAGTTHKSLRGWTLVALVLLGSQILIGGLTSANFGATACQTFPDCHGSWLPGPALAGAFDLWRQHEIDAQGIVHSGAAGAAIHKTHRLVAVLTLAALLVAGLAAFRIGGELRNVAVAILMLAAAEFSVGVAATMTSLPISLAVAHNWLAALLLLSLLKLLSLSTAGVGD